MLILSIKTAVFPRTEQLCFNQLHEVKKKYSLLKKSTPQEKHETSIFEKLIESLINISIT